MQKLLYSQPPPFDTMFCCAAGNIPASVLIEQLYFSIITAYSVLSFPENSEDDSKCASICANFGNFAVFIDRRLTSLANDCQVVEERYPVTSNDALIAEIFRVLAEVLFLAYKIIISFQEKTDRCPVRFVLPEKVANTMDLIKRHAMQYGFSPEGLDRWVDDKTKEDYAVLFDVIPPGSEFSLVEKTIKGQIKQWSAHMLRLTEDVLRVGKSRPAVWKKGQRSGTLLKLWKRADGKIVGWLENLMLRV
ncbi:hypothetical protein N7G274_009885 [Stereocaulon virgatum]|uniref:Uncharacterized protein n=1 Tax=Stereocaulon virgatum TaxID=373712 RepID=A0ABR3ZUW9_9LECA